ncbi:MAG: cyclic nucleotide-binding domain-containing protein [Myxococcota bacterium]
MNDDLRRQKDRASAAYAEKRYRDALSLFQGIVAQDPSDLVSRMKVGDIHRRLEQTAAAVDTYAEVARRYAQEGFLLKAIAVCKVLLAVDPRHTETQSMLAELYAQRRIAPDAARKAGLPSAPDRVDAGRPPSLQGRAGAEFATPSAAAAPIAPAQYGSPPSPRRTKIPPADTWAGRIDVSAFRGGGASTELTNGHRPPTGSSSTISPPASPSGSRPVDPSSPAQPLPEIPLFSDLPRAAFIELLMHLKVREVLSGQDIIREGDVGDSFYVVASGRVRVTRRNESGQQILLARLRDGAFFGEMASLQPGPRTATVTAEVDSEILELSRDVLERVARGYPGVAQVLDDFRQQRLLATAMATHELFRPFGPDARRRLMEQFKGRTFEKGAVLLREGQPASGLYILLYGSLSVTTRRESGPVSLAELVAGDMFGEMSLLHNDPISATVVAEADCFVIRLSRTRFQEVMMTHPHVLEVVSRISEERQQDNDQLMGVGVPLTAAILV